jgi:hypothetical protein
MVGDVIYPLNRLAEVAADVYELQRAKYAGREGVLDAPISESGLLFNDTVHCSPVHLHWLYAAREQLGMRPSAGLAFQIPVNRLQPHTVYWYRWETPWINGYPNEDVALAPPLEEFEPFDAERYRELSDVPERHRSYLRRMQRQGRRPLMFVHIPHVLVAGPIDIRGLRLVDWSRPPSEQSSGSRRASSS